jgi:hypothetical protein
MPQIFICKFIERAWELTWIKYAQAYSNPKPSRIGFCRGIFQKGMCVRYSIWYNINTIKIGQPKAALFFHKKYIVKVIPWPKGKGANPAVKNILNRQLNMN